MVGARAIFHFPAFCEEHFHPHSLRYSSKRFPPRSVHRAGRIQSRFSVELCMSLVQMCLHPATLTDKISARRVDYH